MMSVHVRVSGRVQGVYYRAYTRDRAKSLGINGWVRNIPGGGRAGGAVGQKPNVGELLRAMKSGPSGSVVLGMELSEIEAKGYNDFEIKY
jgi:acylphosphatase